MNVSLHFKDDNITPCKWMKGSFNTHNIPCQQMQFGVSNGNLLPKGIPYIRLSFSPSDLQDKDVKLVILNREIARNCRIKHIRV